MKFRLEVTLLEIIAASLASWFGYRVVKYHKPRWPRKPFLFRKA